GCGRRTLLANAANGYRRIAGRLAARQSEPGYQRLQIRDDQNALLIEGGLGLRGYGDRDAIDRIAAPSSRDDHFFRRLFLGKRRRLHCKQGGARSYYAATRLDLMHVSSSAHGAHLTRARFTSLNRLSGNKCFVRIPQTVKPIPRFSLRSGARRNRLFDET